MKKIVFSVGAIVALASAVSSYAGPEYGYSFDPGNQSLTPANIDVENGDTASFTGAGELFLDSSSSISGSISDILSGSLTFDLSSYGETSVNPSPDYVTFSLSQCIDPTTGQSDLQSTGTFSWTSSQITSMDITGAVILDDIAYPFVISAGPNANENYMEFGTTDPYSMGNWNFAPVPDSAPTALLAGLSTLSLCLFQRKLAKA